MDWKNDTGLDFEKNLDDYLGFIYEINLNDGRFYIGRKQFWRKQGKSWRESDWREYYSSSNTVKANREEIEDRRIIAVFTSKSAIRYAEAAAIIISGSYLPRTEGLNWSFEGCKGTIKLEGSDAEQLERLWVRYDGPSFDFLQLTCGS